MKIKLFFLLFLVFSLPCKSRNWIGEIVIGKDQYISAQTVFKNYNFHELKRQNENIFFKHLNVGMKWEIGLPYIHVNSIKYNLENKIQEFNGEAYINKIDVIKKLIPIFNPKEIKNRVDFDTVIIDPGHGGSDNGGRGMYGYFEKDYTLMVSYRLKRYLENYGFKVHLTRNKDYFVSLEDRPKFVNGIEKAIFISIHFNATKSSRTDANGIETFVVAPFNTKSFLNNKKNYDRNIVGNTRDQENIALATAIHSHVMSNLNSFDRGIKYSVFAVLKRINKPGVLVELGFLNNKEDAYKIHRSDYRDKLAEKIGRGIYMFKQSMYD